MDRAREAFEQAGARLVVIGQATPRHAAHFRRKLELEVPVLADEDRSSYRAAGLRRASTAQLIGPRSVLSGIRHGARSGVTQGRVVGDVAQLGGAIVIGPDGEVALRQASAHAGDTAEPADLVAAVRASTAGELVRD